MMPPEPVAVVESINVNPNGGVPKHPVPEAEIAVDRVPGDKQNNTAHHGGIWRAVSLYSSELIAALQDEGHAIVPGSVGENLTIRGLPWPRLDPGDRLIIGAVELEITGYAPPCQKIASVFHDGRSIRINQKLHPGWSRLYARVLKPGVVHRGEMVVLVEHGICEPGEEA
jgi:MOSC domain-containing protein YiiM